MSKESNEMARQLGMFFVVSSTFVGSTAVGLGLGWLLWKKAGFPWWTMLFTIGLGLTAACVQVIRYERMLEKEEKK